MKALRDYKRLAKAEGLRVVDVRINGHVHMTLESPTGGSVVIHAAATPSDWRALRNVRAFMRRSK
jgi:hypothetical protein